jgi:flagellar hook-associated protein 1 FlgK
MSSISNVLNIAASGLQTAQAQVSVTSDNISNVNTAGYARKIANQSEIVAGGTGNGVKVASITRAADQFLTQASLSATATAGAASTLSTFLDQAQALFGDPSSDTSFFSGLNSVYSAFATAANTPSSTLTRGEAVSSVTTFLSSASNLNDSLSSLQSQTSTQITTDVATVNSILSQLSQTNSDISRTNVAGGDITGLQDNQAQLLNQLAGLVQVQVLPNATGGVSVRSADGTSLVGTQGAATLAYDNTTGVMTATPQGGTPQQLRIGSGAIAGLMQMTDVDLPQLSSQLSQFVSSAVDQINAAHNAATAIPPPTTLTGSNIGMDLSTAISGFSGKTTIAVTNASGIIQQRVDITFAGGAGTMSVNGGTATNFTAGNFLTALNTALGGSATASFSNGALSISAASNVNGVSIQDDATTPSQNINGEGFSQFFGLNNLIQQNAGSSNYATGLTTSSPNTFTAGGTLTLEIQDSTGAGVRQATVTVPSGTTTVANLISGLNAGVGAYGSFALDSTGALVFTPASGSGVSLSVVNDTTANTIGGLSLSQTFGIGADVQSSRTGNYAVRSDIAADPTKLAFSALDLTQSVGGSPALASGDGSGALAISQSGAVATAIPASGDMTAMKTTVTDYASQLAGHISVKSAAAATAQQSAAALSTQADSQRSSVEGVNMDEELVNLTTYQQSYSACSRLIQAAQDMFTTLLQMV